MNYRAYYAQTVAEEHAAAAATFANSTNDFASRIACAIVDAYDFSHARCVIDVGGGSGQLMSALLLANPRLNGVIQDRTPMIALALRELLKSGLTQRCELVVDDFFEAVPNGGDVYILKQILRDYNDAASISILRRCRSAMPPYAKLLIAEHVFNARYGSQPSQLVATLTTKNWRDERDYEMLLNEAGFGATRILPTSSALHLIEASR
jgi:tRNA A58 N-methylase Trm61